MIAEPTPIAPRPELAAPAMDAHGGPNDAELVELGLRREDVVDFSASTNPFGPPPGVAQALAGCDVTRYPDRWATALCEALAEHAQTPVDHVVVANGAAQLIWTIAFAYLRPGDTAFVIGPTFGEYRVASHLMGAQVVEWRTPPAKGELNPFRPDLEDLAAALAAADPRLVWLCNPNNPTGIYLGEPELARLRAAAPGAQWVLDESYRPFVTASWDSLPLIDRGDAILLRSLTKDCTLPGLRLGYALAAPALAQALGRALPPWNVSSPAMAAGLAALSNYSYVRTSLLRLRAETARLRLELVDRGWRVPPSATNFLLAGVTDAVALRRRLLVGYSLQVRDCSSFGLPAFIRIGARTRTDNDRLLAALDDLAPLYRAGDAWANV